MRRHLLLVVGVLVAAGAAVAVVLGGESSPSAGAPSNAGTASGATAGATAVQRRNLTETDTESGTLSYANTYTVYDRVSGTITWLPAVGQVIKPGQALYDVAGAPVTLMNGATPAYRDLKSSDSAGPDLLELNRDLVKLGFDPEGIVVDDEWQAATTDGVELFQESLGETETGDLKLGQLVFLPGDQLVSSVSTTSGATASYLGGSSTEFVSLTRSKRRKKSRTAKTISALKARLKALTAELNAERSHSGSGSSKSGKSSSSSGSHSGSSSSNSGGGAGATAIMETSSTRLVATVDLDATKQSEARVGERVQVELPSGSFVGGRISAVSPVAQSSGSGSGNGNGGGSGGGGGGSGGSSGGAVIPVTISLAGREAGAGLDQAAVSVSFSEAEANNVLSVPVTALLATSGGGYEVQEAAAPHALLPVTTGLFAAGYVAISGSGIYPGLEVTDSQG